MTLCAGRRSIVQSLQSWRLVAHPRRGNLLGWGAQLAGHGSAGNLLGHDRALNTVSGM